MEDRFPRGGENCSVLGDSECHSHGTFRHELHRSCRPMRSDPNGFSALDRVSRRVGVRFIGRGRSECELSCRAPRDVIESGFAPRSVRRSRSRGGLEHRKRGHP